MSAGSRVGSRSELVGSAVYPADDEGQGGLFTKDALSGIFIPGSASELTSAGFPAPSSIWRCQEAVGNLADSVGPVTLTQTGAGHLYQQAVTGWASRSVSTTDGSANQRWVNTTTGPDPSTTSVAMLAYLRMPTAAPAAIRDLIGAQNNVLIRLLTTGVIRQLGVAANDGAGAAAGAGVIPVFMRYDRTNSNTTFYTSQEKKAGVFSSAATAGILTFLGGQTTTAGDTGYVWAAQWIGAAAEMADATIHALLVALGWSLAW